MGRTFFWLAVAVSEATWGYGPQTPELRVSQPCLSLFRTCMRSWKSCENGGSHIRGWGEVESAFLFSPSVLGPVLVVLRAHSYL